MKNIYIETLKLGFENPEGISLNEAKELLKIDFKGNNSQEFNYITWFYTNFFNSQTEGIIAAYLTMANYWNSPERERVEGANNHKSYIKGDAVNKYIDYLELERTRKSSKQASYYATGSIFIAILAVLIPYLISPETISINGKVNLVSVVLSILVFGYSIFMVSNAEPDRRSTKLNFWSFSIITLILSVILSFFIIQFIAKLLLNPTIIAFGLSVLPIVIYAVGHILRKHRETFSRST